MKLDLYAAEMYVTSMKVGDRSIIEPFVFWLVTPSKSARHYSFYCAKSEGRRVLKDFIKAGRLRNVLYDRQAKKVRFLFS